MKKKTVLYKFMKSWFGKLVIFWFNPKIEGKENMKVDGPVIIASNHLHAFDPYWPVISSNRMIHYMAKKECFDNIWIRWFVKGMGCISVDRKNKNDEAINKSIEILKNDGAVGIFPEGTRNRTNEILKPFKFGAVSLASKTGATIIPVGISGKYKFRSKNLVVRYGKPFKVDNISLEEANEKLMEEIKKLILGE